MAQQDEYFMFVYRQKIALPTEEEGIVTQSIHDALLQGAEEMGTWIIRLERECEFLSHDVFTYKNTLFLSVMVGCST